jgi:ribose-phosphate pyrophosphokinase
MVEFPNENLFVRLKHSVRGQDVYVIQQTATTVHRNLMELLITLQTLRLDSAARITAVIPYLCYGRSDKKDQPRVPITGRLVADMIEVAGADRYMTLDPHAGQIQGFFSIPGDVLTASRLIIDEIRTTLLPHLQSGAVATDLGFAKSAQLCADLGMPWPSLRSGAGNEARAEALSLIGEVQGSDVIVVDDEVDTGSSIIQAIKVAKEHGALDVYLAFVHAILSADAAQNLAAFINASSPPNGSYAPTR